MYSADNEVKITDLADRIGATTRSTLQFPLSSALDEETARAEVYGLLAQLFYAPPAPELFDALRVAATEAPAPGRLPGGALARTGGALRAT